MIRLSARAGLAPTLGAVLCALMLNGCDGGDMGAGPAAPTEGEAQALADAEAMLQLREAPQEPEQDVADNSETPDSTTTAD